MVNTDRYSVEFISHPESVFKTLQLFLNTPGSWFIELNPLVLRIKLHVWCVLENPTIDYCVQLLPVAVA